MTKVVKTSLIETNIKIVVEGNNRLKVLRNIIGEEELLYIAGIGAGVLGVMLDTKFQTGSGEIVN